MKKLKRILPKRSGRDASGKVSVRHQGGRKKRYLRVVDFGRSKRDVWGKIESIEYDPNRNAEVARVIYEDGQRGYILAPQGLKVGQKVMAADIAPLEVGNALPLSGIPAGTEIHNIEIVPGKGGQMVRGAGSSATVQGKEDNYILVKLPSGEIRRFSKASYASIGKVGNADIRTRDLGKAGRKRNMGIRPRVRGVAMHPKAHPHGGGEGRSGVGMKFPKTVYGKAAVGKTRRRRKYSDYLIVSPRKKGPHVG